MHNAFYPALCIARQEYSRFMRKSTSLIMLFSLAYFWERIIFPTAQLCETYGFTIHPVEGYLHILTDGTQAFIVPLMLVALLSDFPSEKTSGLFFLVRAGRGRWMVGQLIFALMAGLTYLVILLAGTGVFLLPYAQWGNWGSFNTSLAGSFPQIYQDQHELFLSAAAIAQGRPIGVMLQATMLALEHLFLISLILMFFKLMEKRMLGLLITVVLTISGFVSVEIVPQAEWLFPMAHGMFSTHFEGILAKPICPLQISGLYFVGSFTIFLFLNWKAVKRCRLGDEL